MENLFYQLLESIGEDPQREGLVKTPRRAAETYRYLTQGYQIDINDVIKDGIFDCDLDEMVILKGIELYSLCEHHLLPFTGKCHVAYIPKGKIIGLSRISRLVDIFSQRLQVQERLTKQIAETLMQIVDPLGVGVVIEAEHLCAKMIRNAKQHSLLSTSCMLGAFRKDSKTRSEFLTLIKKV